MVLSSRHQFRKFANDWDFEHRTSSPGNSKANGKVESAVKTAKNLLRKALSARTDPYIAILDYRNTPTQGMNRRTTTLLPTTKTLLQPRAPQSERDIQQLNRRQFQQSKYYNKHARDLPTLKVGDVVCMKPFQLGSKGWKKGTITSKLDERSYMVKTPDGDTYRRNRYRLRQTKENSDPKEASDTSPCRRPEDQATPAGPTKPSSPANAEQTTAATPKTTIALKTAVRPQRIRRPPQYLKGYVLTD